MGIPGYTKWLRTRFAGCFHALDLRKPLQSQHPRARRGYDHVHFDLAARLYLVAARAKSTPHLLKLWLTDLHRMSVWTAPRRTVSLCIDGVPPAAKLWTQRLRRHERTWQPPPSTSAAAAADDGGGGVNSLSFTLGTRIMSQIGSSLPFFACQALQSRGCSHLTFLVSGPDVPGEGEHKLHRRVLRCADDDCSSPKGTYHLSTVRAGAGAWGGLLMLGCDGALLRSCIIVCMCTTCAGSCARRQARAISSWATTPISSCRCAPRRRPSRRLRALQRAIRRPVGWRPLARPSS
jgi:5'-3' exonuclease